MIFSSPGPSLHLWSDGGREIKRGGSQSVAPHSQHMSAGALSNGHLASNSTASHESHWPGEAAVYQLCSPKRLRIFLIVG